MNCSNTSTGKYEKRIEKISSLAAFGRFNVTWTSLAQKRSRVLDIIRDEVFKASKQKALKKEGKENKPNAAEVLIMMKL